MNHRNTWKKAMMKYWQMYLLLIPVIVYFVVFKYVPMAGVQIAFKNFKVRGGIWGSPWIGLKHFRDFFGSATAGKIILNTFLLSAYYLVASFPIPILLAICLNECRSDKFRKFTQMITYMPYFISTVVLVSMILQFTDISTGIVNQLLAALGASPKNFMGNIQYFRGLYVWTGVWQSMGYSAIV